MRILITGHLGFIGQHLSRELENAGHDVFGVDIKDANRGLCDLRLLGNIGYHMQRSEAEVVVHLAAKVGRQFGEDNPMETVVDNSGMTALVAKECGDNGVRLVYASTSEVYGDNGNEVCDEDEGPFTLPHNLYGLSKSHAEHICELYAPHQLTTLRFSMPYGPGLPAGRGRAAIINMLWQARTGQKIPVHVGAERSWCWIGDTVRATRMVIEQTSGGTFNVGRDDQPVPMRVVAEHACALTGAPTSLIEEVAAPSNQTVVKRLSTERVRALGWSPEVDLEDGMRRCLDWVDTLASDGSVTEASVF